jgi:hypothetical protein
VLAFGGFKFGSRYLSAKLFLLDISAFTGILEALSGVLMPSQTQIWMEALAFILPR